MITTKSDPVEFTSILNRNIIKINRWFKSNSLSLNIDKTHFFQFHMKINQNYDIQTSYENKQIPKVQNIKFLGIIIDSNLSCKQHIDNIIPKLNKACFAIRSIKPFMSLEAMRLIYFLISTLSYLMGLYSGVIQYIAYTSLKFKREPLDYHKFWGK